jgi:hypothetical protein
MDPRKRFRLSPDPVDDVIKSDQELITQPGPAYQSRAA